MSSSFAVRSALALLVAAPLVAPLGAVTPITPQKTAGDVRVNGKPLPIAHAYLFHAPDNWEAKQTNSVVILTGQPLDEAKLKAAKTLAQALQAAPQRIVVEVRPENRADLSICHPEFGDGMCYSTTISGPDEWKAEPAAAGHLGGHVRIFAGHEDTVLDKYKLFYDFTFDAAPVADFAQRR
jgi:hypothetical protein